jgi:hypothetical protein
MKLRWKIRRPFLAEVCANLAGSISGGRFARDNYFNSRISRPPARP